MLSVDIKGKEDDIQLSCTSLGDDSNPRPVARVFIVAPTELSYHALQLTVISLCLLQHQINGENGARLRRMPETSWWRSLRDGSHQAPQHVVNFRLGKEKGMRTDQKEAESRAETYLDFLPRCIWVLFIKHRSEFLTIDLRDKKKF